MAHDVRKLKATADRNELLQAMLSEVPALAFISRADPDPRLIRLARLLGKQLARQNFEAQTAKQELEGS